MARKIQSSHQSFLKQPVFITLLAILALGACFRFYNPNWNLGHEIHPDERNILNAVSEIRYESGFKVSFFAYGQLPAYLYRLTGEMISAPRFLSDLFHGNAFGTLAVYWVFLLALFTSALWFFSREKWKLQAFGVSFALFAAALVLRFFNVFNSWFSFLEGQTLNQDLLAKIHLNLPILPLVSFAVVAVVSLGVSFFVAWILEREWLDWPFYIALGVIFLLGFVPALLPEEWHVAPIISTFSFTLGLLVLAGLFAWNSIWGRMLLGIFPICCVFASLEHAWPSFADAEHIMVIGHLWAAFFSTLTILVVYIFVRKAYNNIPMALLAAAAFAFSAISIEQAHYLITESFITLMFVVIALCAFNISENGSLRSYLWAGTAFGLAMAAKTSSLYYVFMIVAGHPGVSLQDTGKKLAKHGPFEPGRKKPEQHCGCPFPGRRRWGDPRGGLQAQGRNLGPLPPGSQRLPLHLDTSVYHPGFHGLRLVCVGCLEVQHLKGPNPPLGPVGLGGCFIFPDLLSALPLVSFGFLPLPAIHVLRVAGGVRSGRLLCIAVQGHPPVFLPHPEPDERGTLVASGRDGRRRDAMGFGAFHTGPF